MKAVILAGGLGTRISEGDFSPPQAMVEIGGRPILWHILKIYSQHGHQRLHHLLRLQGLHHQGNTSPNYFLHTSDVTFDMTSNKMTVHTPSPNPGTSPSSTPAKTQGPAGVCAVWPNTSPPVSRSA